MNVVSNVLYDEPVETIKARLEEKINRARWTGDWEGIPLRLREKYNDVPSHLQKTMKTMLASIDSMDAFPYQKFDAALAALRGRAMLTHNMGLGKTRIAIMALRLLDKPALIVALPRLVRTVWARELDALGIDDWVILERPRRSKVGKDGKLSGFTRKNRVTTDPGHPAKIKIVSYNMLLPAYEERDYVICPSCGLKHREAKCPGIMIYINNPYDDTRTDHHELNILIRDLQHRYGRGDITIVQLIEEIKKLNRPYHVQPCRKNHKGSLCPECGSVMENNGKPSTYCHKCGYSARTWVPPLTRRLKNRVKVMVIDESQAVKNESLRSQYTLSIRPKYRFLTSGTPATVDVGDLYRQIKWVLGKGIMFPYNTKESFVYETWSKNEEGIKRLHKLLDPIQIRRNADDFGVNSEIALPPVKEKTFAIQLSTEEMENYMRAHEDIKKWLLGTGEDVSDVDLFSKMWILRRATCVPWVDNPRFPVKSTRIDALKIEIESYLAQGRKVLIGSEMIDVLDAIEKTIPGVARIDGSTPIHTSTRIIDLFQDTCPDCHIAMVEESGKMVCPLCEKKFNTPQVLIASRKAVGEGVTLNRASVVIFTDPSWTYADMWQFWKRAHRIGATYEHLDVIYMIAPWTIEEKMLHDAEQRKVYITKAINRKDAAKAERVNIRDFVSELFGVTVSGSIKRQL